MDVQNFSNYTISHTAVQYKYTQTIQAQLHSEVVSSSGNFSFIDFT